MTNHDVIAELVGPFGRAAPQIAHNVRLSPPVEPEPANPARQSAPAEACNICYTFRRRSMMNWLHPVFTMTVEAIGRLFGLPIRLRGNGQAPAQPATRVTDVISAVQ
jgi:hypothetical protein